MNLETARFLLTDEGRRLIDEVSTSGRAFDELAVAGRLRRSHPHDQVAAAMTLVRLRERAVEKLGPAAAQMYLTTGGLQQATHRVVAAHRARRTADSHPERLVDLTTGIGADLVAFAQAGCPVAGVERDPVTALFAQANLAALRLSGEVELGSAESHPLEPTDVCFVDPARRGPRGRVFDPDQYSPTWTFVEQLLERDTVVKVAPGLPYSRVPAAAEAEWVSLSGRLREAVIWTGRFATEVRRRATVLGGDIPAELTDRDLPSDVPVAKVGGYVHEPDDAVVRSHLVGAYAAQVDGWLLDPHLAYVSTDQDVRSALGRGYRVLETLPYREKALRAALRERDIGPLTIKKRGISVTPEALRDRLRLSGSTPATLILTRTPRSAQALLVEPI